MPSRYNRDDDIFDTLCRNKGRLCTVFTTSGGRSGDGFTGVVSNVDTQTCQLVSTSPFDSFGSPGRPRTRCGCGGRGVAGVTQTIPLDKICCISTSQF